jgi:DNA-directed RNA polymerase specialized sigma24 family protein
LELNNEFYHKLLLYAKKMMFNLNLQDAEDVLQDALLKFYISPSGDLVYARNYIKQASLKKQEYNKASKRNAPTSDIATPEVENLSSDYDADEVLASNLMQQSVINFLKSNPELHPDQRAILASVITGEHQVINNLTNHRNAAFEKLEFYIKQVGAVA